MGKSYDYVIVFCVGCVAGAITVIVGEGLFLTLPVLRISKV